MYTAIYAYLYIFINDSNIKNLNTCMCANHITNGSLHKKKTH